MKEYQLIVFDVDGTLYNSYYSITKTFQHSVRELCGIDEPDLDVFRKFIGPPLIDSFAAYGFEGDALQRAVRFYRKHYQTTLGDSYLYDGILDVLEALRCAGKTVVVASSKQTQVIVDLFERDNLTVYFDLIAGLEQEGTRETKTQVIGRVLEHYPLIPHTDAVMIGDRFYDAAGAQNNGIDFIAAGYGFGERSEFAAYPMVLYAQTPADMRTGLLQEKG